MRRRDLMLWMVLALCGLAAGCGTTRVTDTQRCATEQLLVSNAIDQVVSQFDFRALAGKPVYFDPQYLDGAVDKGYLISSLRQHLLANGCILQEDRAKATYVVEARTGAIGTDRTRPDFGVVSAPPAQLARTRIAEAAKSTSRQRRAMSSPRRSPVNAAVR